MGHAAQIVVLLVCAFEIALALYVFLESPRSHLHRLATTRSMAVAIYAFATFIFLQSIEYQQSLLWSSIRIAAYLLIPAIYFHFVWYWSNRYHRRITPISIDHYLPCDLHCPGGISRLHHIGQPRSNEHWIVVAESLSQLEFSICGSSLGSRIGHGWLIFGLVLLSSPGHSQRESSPTPDFSGLNTASCPLIDHQPTAAGFFSECCHLQPIISPVGRYPDHLWHFPKSGIPA